LFLINACPFPPRDPPTAIQTKRQSCSLLLAATPLLEARTFTSSNGKKLEAEVLSATESKVELKVVNGKTYNVPLSKISKEDRDYVAQWRAEKLKTEALKGVDLAQVMQANERPGTEILLAGGVPVVELNLNGHATKFVLNPITPQSLLIAPGAEDAGIDVTVPEGGQLPQGVQGIAEPTVDIGGQEIATPLKMLVVEPQALSEKLRQQADGIIGSGFLKDSGAVVDWAAMKIWFPAKSAESAETPAENGEENADDDKKDEKKDDK